MFLLCIGTTSTCVHFAYIPKGFKEYSVSVYAVSAMLTTTICFIGVVWNIPTISKYFDYFEKIINQSEVFFHSKVTYIFSVSISWLVKNCAYFKAQASQSTNNVQTNQSHNWNGMSNRCYFCHEISIPGLDAFIFYFELRPILCHGFAERCIFSTLSFLVSHSITLINQ